MRDNVIKKKEREAAKAEKRKRDFIDLAINEGMTEEQRNIIAQSKNENNTDQVD